MVTRPLQRYAAGNVGRTGSLRFGHTNYPRGYDQSWLCWNTNGARGEALDTGEITLADETEFIESPVECLPLRTNPIRIIVHSSSGTPTILMRTSARNFSRGTDTLAWDTTASKTTIDQFVQVKVLGAATVDDVVITWVPQSGGGAVVLGAFGAAFAAAAFAGAAFARGAFRRRR